MLKQKYTTSLLLLRIKVDDKLYRPITHYRDTILHLVDYFEHLHSSVLPSFRGDKRGAALSTAYLYAGRVFADLGDAPQALDYYQRALDALPKTPSANSGYSARRLYKQRGLLHSFMGELFHLQGLYRESLESFKQANHWAKLANDTLDMIFNYRDIAEQYKFINENDSSLLFYQKASSLSDRVGNNYMSIEIKGQIGSLYNKLGKYHLALSHARPMLEGLDSLHYSSTYAILSESYYELGQEDSAEFYLEKLQQFGNLYGKEYACEHLSQLALKKHDLENAHYYFLFSKQYDDSLRKLDKAEAVARMHAAYNYQIHERKAKELELDNEKKKTALVLSTSIFIIFILLLVSILFIYRKKRREQETKIMQLQETRNVLLRSSDEYKAQTRRTIRQLEQSIQEMKESSLKDKAQSEDLIKKLESEKNSLQLQLKSQEMAEVHKSRVDGEVCLTSIYQRFKSLASHQNHPTDEEWQELSEMTNQYYLDFDIKLLQLKHLSTKQYRVCLLRKLKFSTSEVCTLLCCAKTTVYSSCTRLYKDFFGKPGSVNDFDHFLDIL